jgi:hypothetical protein
MDMRTDAILTPDRACLRPGQAGDAADRAFRAGLAAIA